MNEIAMRILNNPVATYHRRDDVSTAIHAATMRLALPAEPAHRDTLQAEFRAIQPRLN
jgi:hypothetical protein